jgi:hypothetical protein
MGTATLEGAAMIRSLLTAIVITVGLPVYKATASESSPEILVVVGAAGGDEYAQAFEAAAQTWRDAAQSANADLSIIGVDANDPSDVSDRDRMKAWIDARLDASGRPIWLILIGHGTFARDVAKFNLRGPDFSAAELATWISDIKRPIAIVNGASASAPFINRLSGQGRVIVTATKSGTEQNYARFGGMFAAAIASMDSDLDHDDEISIHEAFLKASVDVQRFYDSKDRIATEHALIDDNGDGRGTPASVFRGIRVVTDKKKDAASDSSLVDGSLASRMTWSPSGSSLSWSSEQLERRASIEQKIDSLRLEKSALDPDDYFKRLEPLMVDLALLYRDVETKSDDAQPSNDASEPTKGDDASSDVAD